MLKGVSAFKYAITRTIYAESEEKRNRTSFKSLNILAKKLAVFSLKKSCSLLSNIPLKLQLRFQVDRENDYSGLYDV